MTYREKLYQMNLEFIENFKGYSEAVKGMRRNFEPRTSDFSTFDVLRRSRYEAFSDSFSKYKKLQSFVIEKKIDDRLNYTDPFA